ncbi:hypothetical protein D3C72_788850 [compost metagenome]
MYEMVKVAYRKKVDVSTTFAPMAISTSRQWCCKVSLSGMRALLRVAWIFLNDGVSPTALRIHMPTITNTMEPTNGMRQPQDWNASSLMLALSSDVMTLPSARPNTAPVCGTAP